MDFVLGIAIGTVLLGIVIVLALSSSDEAPPELRLVRGDGRGRREALFRATRAKKQAYSGAGTYQRPLDVQPPDDAVLVPPRDVDGVNQEP
jgi:hypothetical protein